MHQPFYEDPFTGKFELPWVRLHGLKDYFGMVNILKDFPRIRMTFNLVPSLLQQLEKYTKGRVDLFQEIFLKEAESLNDREIDFLVRHFFSAHYDHLIKPFNRYEALFRKKQHYKEEDVLWSSIFTVSELRDLQVWFQLCYFDEEYKQGDERIKGLIGKGDHFSESDKSIIAETEMEILKRIIPEYRKFFEAGQIEISASPFYHPILPLLIDPQLGRAANPRLPEYDLHFNWTEDAVCQVKSALDYMENVMGRRPKGVWPSEGSLSAEVLTLLEKLGVQWTATDEMILSQSLGIPIERDRQGTVQNPGIFYRPYSLEGNRIRIFFRDHQLSDLIGFYYQKIPSEEAAADLVRKIKAIPRPNRQEVVIPIILDGENAWEYYENSGRDFLRQLYALIETDDTLETVTFSDALNIEAGAITNFLPGSWINGNFDIWIGHEEDRRAWRLLQQTKDLIRKKAFESGERQRDEIDKMIHVAEGSDWYWWYGRENYTPDLDIFDRLFRQNLLKVYHTLEEEPPPELLSPISSAISVNENKIVPPGNFITPPIDGREGHYFEWLGAGRIDVTQSGTTMQVGQPLLQSILYGFDQEYLYLRLNTTQPARTYLDQGYSAVIDLRTHHTSRKIILDPQNEKITVGIGSVIDTRLPLDKFPLREEHSFQLAMEWLLNGSRFRRIPLHGYFTIEIPSEKEYAKNWLV